MREHVLEKERELLAEAAAWTRIAARTVEDGRSYEMAGGALYEAYVNMNATHAGCDNDEFMDDLLINAELLEHNSHVSEHELYNMAETIDKMRRSI